MKKSEMKEFIQKASHIEFVFENCESIILPTTLARVSDVKIKKTDSGNKLKQILVKFTPAASDYTIEDMNKNGRSQLYDLKQKPLERIMRHQDITHIVFIQKNNNDKKLEFCTTWNYLASDQYNIYQHVHYNEDKKVPTLSLSIGKKVLI